MSHHYLQLIPGDRQFVPTGDAQKKAAEYLFDVFPEKGNLSLEHFPDCNGIEFKEFGNVQYISAGDNDRWAFCPSCRRQFARESEDLRDLGGREFEKTWRKTWNLAYESGCEGLTLEMPCCGQVVYLTDLTFDSPGGFARFVIEIDTRQELLSTDERHRLEDILGCEILQIQAAV